MHELDCGNVVGVFMENDALIFVVNGLKEFEIEDVRKGMKI